MSRARRRGTPAHGSISADGPQRRARVPARLPSTSDDILEPDSSSGVSMLGSRACVVNTRRHPDGLIQLRRAVKMRGTAATVAVSLLVWLIQAGGCAPRVGSPSDGLVKKEPVPQPPSPGDAEGRRATEAPPPPAETAKGPTSPPPAEPPRPKESATPQVSVTLPKSATPPPSAPPPQSVPHGRARLRLRARPRGRVHLHDKALPLRKALLLGRGRRQVRPRSI